MRCCEVAVKIRTYRCEVTTSQVETGVHWLTFPCLVLSHIFQVVSTSERHMLQSRCTPRDLICEHIQCVLAAIWISTSNSQYSTLSNVYGEIFLPYTSIIAKVHLHAPFSVITFLNGLEPTTSTPSVWPALCKLHCQPRRVSHLRKAETLAKNSIRPNYAKTVYPR